MTGPDAVTRQESARRLFERESELEQLDDLLRQARSGRGGSLIVQGAPGIGKTRLLAAARDRAAEAGLRVFAARGTELERDFAFGVVRQLYEPTLMAAGGEERADLLRGAARLAESLFGEWVEDAGKPRVDALYPRLHGLYWLTVNLAERNAVLLAVDDAHWADQSSLRFLQFLLPRLDEHPLALIVSARDSEPDAPPLLAELSSDPAAYVVKPPPLTKPGVASFIRETIGDEADDVFCAACHRATGGNPFLLTELAAEIDAQRIRPVAAEAQRVREHAPETVSRAVLARFRRLPDAALRLAQAVAVLGDAADLRRAADLAGLDEATATDSADLLAAASILDPGLPLTFAHPLIRSAVYDDFPGARRADVHHRAARLLLSDQASPEGVATHLLASEPRGDPAFVSVLTEAARRATARGAPDAALTYLQRALAEPPEPELRPSVAQALIAAAHATGELGAVVEISDAVEELAVDPVTVAESMPELAVVLIATGQQERAVRVVEQAGHELSTREPELALRLEAEWWLMSQWNRDALLRANERLLSLRERLRGTTAAERLVMATLSTVLTFSGADATEVAAVAEGALGNGRLLSEESAHSIPLHLAIMALNRAERLDYAERELEVALADARRRGSRFAYGLACAFQADRAMRLGDVVAAESWGRSATEIARTSGWIALVPIGLSYLTPALIERGQAEEAMQLYTDSGFEADLPHTIGFFLLESTRGRLKLARGDVRRGLEDLLEAGRKREQWHAINPAVDSWASDAAIVLHGLGEADRARELADEELRLARHWGTARAIGIALRGCALVGQRDEGIEMLEEAMRVLESSQARLEYARALIDLGAMLRRSNRRKEGKRHLAEGHALALECGAIVLAERAREELATLGVRPRGRIVSGVEELTASERRVAEMAADGMSNPEIAQALFVTVKTVETHLSRTYRKLDISSRRELKGALDGDQ